MSEIKVMGERPNIAELGKNTRWKPGQSGFPSEKQTGVPKPGLAITNKLKWMKRRLAEGKLRPEDNQAIIDMMSSGSKARFKILQELVKMRDDMERPGEQVAWAGKMLEWAKLQYGEKHLNINVTVSTTPELIINRLEEFLESRKIRGAQNESFNMAAEFVKQATNREEPIPGSSQPETPADNTGEGPIIDVSPRREEETDRRDYSAQSGDSNVEYVIDGDQSVSGSGSQPQI